MPAHPVLRPNPSAQTVSTRSQVSPENDAELVERARLGDSRAFEQLYRQAVDRVYSLCLRMTGNADDAAACTSDAFVRAWQSLDRFRGDATFASWMHRLTVNVVLQERRTTRRRDARVRLAHTDGELEQTPGASRDLAGALDLETALAQLSEDARRVVVLHDIAGYRHNEIAALLGVASGTVRARLHHARKELREMMEP